MEYRKLRVELYEPRTMLAANQFAVIGDYGRDGGQQPEVSDLIDTWDVGGILTTGDNNYLGPANIDQAIGKYYHEYIGNYQGSFGAGSSSNRFWPSLGNHDYEEDETAQAYRDYFTLPGNERYYDVVLGDMHLWVTNAEQQEPDGYKASSAQAEWLRSGLAASTSPFDVVIGHRPPYSSGRNYGSHPSRQWPFEAWGAELHLSGHEHNYERLEVGGMTYVVSGLGGLSSPPGYRFDTPLAGSQVRYNANSGALRLTVTSTQLVGEFFSIESGGTLIDRFTISASSGGGGEPPGMSIGDVSKAEGQSGTTAFVFTVSLSAAASEPVTVRYATAAGSATAGADFVAVNGSLTFAAGTTSRTLTVTVIGDSQVEPNETFNVQLSAASGASLIDTQAQATIVNDDGSQSSSIRVSIDNANTVEGNTGTKGLAFTVRLHSASTQLVTVQWHTADKSARAGQDYVAASGTLTFQPGQTVHTITVAIRGDTTREPDEAFDVVLSNPVGAKIGDGRATGKIKNDD